MKKVPLRVLSLFLTWKADRSAVLSSDEYSHSDSLRALKFPCSGFFFHVARRLFLPWD